METKATVIRDQDSDTAELRINMGPQHPATHGVFRMVLTLDGERVVHVEPHIGYLHRGSEKLSEGENFQQITKILENKYPVMVNESLFNDFIDRLQY